MEWSPIVAPASAERHRRAVARWIDAIADRARGIDALHLTMLLAYSDLDVDRDVAALASRGIEEALAEPPRVGAFRGPFAVGWTLAILHASPWGGIDASELLAELESLAQSTVEAQAGAPYGLRTGLVAPAGSLLEQVGERASEGERWASALLDRLEACAVPLEDGIALHTEPYWLLPLVGCEHARGRYDLGMADGAAGVVALLCGLLERGLEPSRAGELLEGIGSWLVAQVDRRGGVPAWVSLEGHAGPTTLGWCAGTAGVASSVHRAGRVLERSVWCTWALDLAERCTLAAAPPAEPDEPWTAGDLCHGAGGIVQSLARLHHASPERTSLRDAALAWIDARLVPCFTDAAAARATSATTLLGQLGAALVLIAAGSERSPSWDRCLLLSSPTAPEEPIQ